MSLPRATPAVPRTDQFACKHCGGPINKWARHVVCEQVQAESIGDQPARTGRLVRLEAGVWCSWPCLQGWIADHHPS